MNPQAERTAEDLVWLASSAGQELLAAAAGLLPDRLTRITRLRRRYPEERVRTAVALLELRRRAEPKFAAASAMYFTPAGLEQSTSDIVARYRASRFPSDALVLDACCGIGGDALALSTRGPVYAVDRDPLTAQCTRLNLLAVAPDAAARVVCVDATRLDLAGLRARGVKAAFLDPSRRAASGGEPRRTRSGADYEPPLAWFRELTAQLPFVAAKVSPGIADDELAPLPAEVEFVSYRGECREAILWSLACTNSQAHDERVIGRRGELHGHADRGNARYRATVLEADGAASTLAPAAVAPPEVRPPQEWLYDPDPAVSRAHLVHELAALLGAQQLDPQIAYVTSATLIQTPFAAAYRVLDWMPFQLKAVRSRLRALGRRVDSIKRRGVPLDPNLLRKELVGAPEGSDGAVVVLTRVQERPVAILCDARTVRT